MANEETPPEWATKAIKEAIDILKSDGVHIHKTYAQFQASLKDKKDGDVKEGETDPKEGEGGAPPEKTDEEKNKPNEKRGFWWGDRANVE